MQDLLSQLSTPIVIGLIIVVVLALVIVVVLARRRRSQQTPPTDPSLSVGGPIDYTSLPLDEEPSGWRERFARLSLAGKILAVLVPILAILGLVALILTLMPTNTPTAIIPTPVPITLTVTDAAVVRAEPLTIGVDVETTGLANGDTVTVEMLEDGQPFPYLNPEQARGTVRRNRVEILVQRAENAPTPTLGRRYTVVVRGPDGQVSSELELTVPTVNRIAETFYGQTAAAPTAEPTAEPTATPEAAPSPEPTVEPTAEPTAPPELPTGPEAQVSNGGNVRRLPMITADNVIGGVNAGEPVQLLARTPNGEWYHVRTVRDEIGWVSVTLLSIPGGTEVPVAPVVTVFVNGPLYELPDDTSTELDRVNQGEVVELTQRTADGTWYEVTNARNQSGWVTANLLGIPDEVAQAVPIAP